MQYSEEIKDMVRTLSNRIRVSGELVGISERERLIISFLVYDIPEDVQVDLLEAHEFFIERPEDFDGSTGDEEAWVTIHEPPSKRHDMDYILYGGTYRGRLWGDLKFRDNKSLYKVNTKYRDIQFYILRWGGYYYQIKNWLKGRRDEPTEEQWAIIRREYTLKDRIIVGLGMITIVPFAACIIGAFINHMKHVKSK